MSTILKALRKLEEETQKGRAGTPPPGPAVGAPSDPPPRGSLIALGLVTLLACGVAGWALWLRTPDAGPNDRMVARQTPSRAGEAPAASPVAPDTGMARTNATAPSVPTGTSRAQNGSLEPSAPALEMPRTAAKTASPPPTPLQPPTRRSVSRPPSPKGAATPPPPPSTTAAPASAPSTAPTPSVTSTAERSAAAPPPIPPETAPRRPQTTISRPAPVSGTAAPASTPTEPPGPQPSERPTRRAQPTTSARTTVAATAEEPASSSPTAASAASASTDPPALTQFRTSNYGASPTGEPTETTENAGTRPDRGADTDTASAPGERVVRPQTPAPTTAAPSDPPGIAAAHRNLPVRRAQAMGLEIQALVWSPNPDSRMAVINGAILHASGSIEDMTITHIGEDYIVVRKGGEELRVDFVIQ